MRSTSVARTYIGRYLDEALTCIRLSNLEAIGTEELADQIEDAAFEILREDR